LVHLDAVSDADVPRDHLGLDDTFADFREIEDE